ncbi:MAG TPA: DUF1573 domain-containing protein [Gemmata sp.]|nr:DUF1573 domain-containing protein [Gemmata sp.]
MKSVVFAIAVLLGTTAPALAGPADLFAERVMDFGTSPKGTVLVHYFRFTNTTKQTLVVGSPRVSCGCTAAAVNTSQIAPGETGVVIAHMDTRRIPTPGVPKSVTIYVPFLAPNQEEVTLLVQTVTRDDLIMSPDRIAFGTVDGGAGAQQSTKVTFTSDPGWKITEAKSNGGFVKADFKEESRNGSFVTYDVTASLDKDCPAGNWISYIYLKTSNPSLGKIRIPVTVNVNKQQAAIRLGNAALGTVPVGVETEKRITIEGKTPFKILEVKGADEQLKVVVSESEARQKHTIVLAANPQTVGGFSRNVELVTDSKEQPKLIIPVTAKVVAK